MVEMAFPEMERLQFPVLIWKVEARHLLTKIQVLEKLMHQE